MSWQVLFFNVQNWLPFACYLLIGCVLGYNRDKACDDIKSKADELKLLEEKYDFLQGLYTEVAKGKERFNNQIIGYKEVNLNLGCPSGTVVAKGKGSGFLSFPEKLDAFLDEIYSGLADTGLDISVKTRIGRYEQDEFYELLDIYNKYPISELIIHPRVQMKHFVVTVGCEYASGGIEIGKMIAKSLGVEYYDRDLIDKVVEQIGVDRELVEKADSGENVRRI